MPLRQIHHDALMGSPIEVTWRGPDTRVEIEDAYRAPVPIPLAALPDVIKALTEALHELTEQEG